MKKEKFTNVSAPAIMKLVEEKRMKLQELRFIRQSGKVTNSAEFSLIRKDIARFLTRLRNIR